MFLDTRLIESVVIQMTGISCTTVYFGFVFLMILLFLMNLHKTQMPVTYQNEHNAVHDARIVDNLRKFILNELYCMNETQYTWTFGTICAFSDSQKCWNFA